MRYLFILSCIGTYLSASSSSFVFDGALTRHQKREKARLFLDNFCDVNQSIQCYDEQCESFFIRPLTLAILLADSKLVIDLLKRGAEVDYLVLYELLKGGVEADYIEEYFADDKPFNPVYNEMLRYVKKVEILKMYPRFFASVDEFFDIVKEIKIIQHHLHDEWWQYKRNCIAGSVLLPRAPVLEISKKRS